ncbi:hypothetical protein ES708_13718 [subsurface metagenome]
MHLLGGQGRGRFLGAWEALAPLRGNLLCQGKDDRERGGREGSVDGVSVSENERDFPRLIVIWQFDKYTLA